MDTAGVHRRWKVLRLIVVMMMTLRSPGPWGRERSNHTGAGAEEQRSKSRLMHIVKKLALWLKYRISGATATGVMGEVSERMNGSEQRSWSKSEK